MQPITALALGFAPVQGVPFSFSVTHPTQPGHLAKLKRMKVSLVLSFQRKNFFF